MCFAAACQKLGVKDPVRAGLQEQYNLWKIKILKELPSGVGKVNGVKTWEIQAVSGLARWDVSQDLVIQTSDRSLLGVTTVLLLLLAFLHAKAGTAGCWAHAQVGRQALCLWGQELWSAPKSTDLDADSGWFCMKAFNCPFIYVWGCSHDEPLDVWDLQEAELTQARKDMLVAKQREIQHFLKWS